MYPHFYMVENVDSPQKFEDALDALGRHSILAVDTETTGLDPLKDQLVSVQVASPTCGYVFTALHVHAWRLKNLLESPSRTLLGQYLPFDFSFLLHHTGIDISKAHIYDTRAVEIAINPEGGHSLKSLHKKYLGTELDKGPQTTFKCGEALSLEQCRYAAIDALCLFPIALGQGTSSRLLGPTDQKNVFLPMRAYLDGIGPFPVRG